MFDFPLQLYFPPGSKTLPCLVGGRTSGKHLSGGLDPADEGDGKNLKFLFTMDADLERKAAATVDG